MFLGQVSVKLRSSVGDGGGMVGRWSRDFISYLSVVFFAVVGVVALLLHFLFLTLRRMISGDVTG
jgi:hypothetical protein